VEIFYQGGRRSNYIADLLLLVTPNHLDFGRKFAILSIVKKTLLALMLLAGGAAFAQVSIGVRIGAPPPPRVVRVRPVAPGPGYAWVDGYWYPVGHRYKWHEGYWTRPPYEGARWIAPHHDGQQFFEGYWEGEHGRRPHDHGWDRDHRNRDYDRH
jgi:hypothetical protein